MSHAEPVPPEGAPDRYVKLALFWAVLGAAAVPAMVPYALAALPALPQRLRLPLPAFILVQTAQAGAVLFGLSWVGLRLGRAVGLGSPFARALVYRRPFPAVSGRGVALALGVGALGGLAFIALSFAFAPFMPELKRPAEGGIALWKRLLAAFYGGITEELLLRLFVMTVLVWLLWKAGPGRGQPPAAWAFWATAVLAAVLFGAGHLPAAAQVWPLTPAVVLRTILLNAIPGVPFGLLYWRWGLEHAMRAHFCADLVLQSGGWALQAMGLA
jgi:membrane protease YdiL (CAAX protease family)